MKAKNVENRTKACIVHSKLSKHTTIEFTGQSLSCNLNVYSLVIFNNFLRFLCHNIYSETVVKYLKLMFTECSVPS